MANVKTETPRNGVRVIALARKAKRNALSRDLIEALLERVREAEAEGTRSIVITGEGPAFSAGADFSDLGGDVSDEGFDSLMSCLTSAISESQMISFAAIKGACVGAGLDLALACDFRVAAPDAIFALPAVQMGILYNPRRLSRILPILAPAAAVRLLLLAERLDRDEARVAGIVTHTAEQDGERDALTVAVELASRAAGLPPNAQSAAKAFVAAWRRPDFEETDWQACRLELLASEERREALQQVGILKK